ncbi:uncharacterized protein LOC133690377 isoform X1 [Populus nigra]|uniref:uncharacterized protein LOC133690377 isoform X1 n=1 Tax=Populus nigra TaxID=3691 RepID=UPI002B26E80E|nr:uncharacterized protein LOC133690377 isoform X1 [Populus nigra]
MGILGMRFFILSSLERKGMGFHEAFSPKKGMKFYPFSRRVLGYSTTLLTCSFADRTSQCFQGRVDGNLSSLHFLKYLNLMFVFKFCAHFGGPVSTAPGLIFTLLRVQRSRRSFRKEVRSERVE